MNNVTIGFLGGIVGGVIKLILDQIAFAVNATNLNTINEFSQIIFGGQASNNSLLGIIIYLLLTGIVGGLVTVLATNYLRESFIWPGVILGLILWGGMNIIFMISGIATPTWSMGAATLVINPLTHMVLGVIITYTVAKFALEAETQGVR